MFEIEVFFRIGERIIQKFNLLSAVGSDENVSE
jgi:hypothetical protein